MLGKHPHRGVELTIKTEPATACPLCGTIGRQRYVDVRDLLLGVPGRWNVRECRADRHLWLDPRPLSSELDKIYRNYYTHVTRRSSSRVMRLLRRWLTASVAASYGYSVGPKMPALGVLLGLFPPIRDLAAADYMWLSRQAGARILDVGAGDGAFLDRMRAAGWTVVGIEPDRNAVAAAAARFGIRLEVGTLEGADLDEASFDAVTLSHVIEHVPDPVDVLARCRALLRAGGRIVVVTPNASSLAHLVFRSSWRGLEPPRHLHVFSRTSLEQVASRAGMHGATVRRTSKSAFWIWIASLRLRSANAAEPRLWSIAAVLSGLLFSFVESLLLPSFGEELLLEWRSPSSRNDLSRT